MPKRINKLLRKIDSSEVQGDGSYVMMKAPTIGDIREGTIPDKSDNAASTEYAVFLLGRLVKEWNWVNDNDEPLPQPNPDIIAELPYPEIKFLMDSLNLEGLSDQKN